MPDCVLGLAIRARFCQTHDRGLGEVHRKLVTYPSLAQRPILGGDPAEDRAILPVELGIRPFATKQVSFFRYVIRIPI